MTPRAAGDHAANKAGEDRKRLTAGKYIRKNLVAKKKMSGFAVVIFQDPERCWPGKTGRYTLPQKWILPVVKNNRAENKSINTSEECVSI